MTVMDRRRNNSLNSINYYNWYDGGNAQNYSLYLAAVIVFM